MALVQVMLKRFHAIGYELRTIGSAPSLPSCTSMRRTGIATLKLMEAH